MLLDFLQERPNCEIVNYKISDLRENDSREGFGLKSFFSIVIFFHFFLTTKSNLVLTSTLWNGTGFYRRGKRASEIK